ncbi:hypothetical protein B0H16DRAFT_1890287, partial [Mycena metata]
KSFQLPSSSSPSLRWLCPSRDLVPSSYSVDVPTILLAPAVSFAVARTPTTCIACLRAFSAPRPPPSDPGTHRLGISVLLRNTIIRFLNSHSHIFFIVLQFT